MEGRGRWAAHSRMSCEARPLNPLIPALFTVLAGSVFLVYNVSRELYHTKASGEQQPARGSEPQGAESPRGGVQGQACCCLLWGDWRAAGPALQQGCVGPAGKRPPAEGPGGSRTLSDPSEFSASPGHRQPQGKRSQVCACLPGPVPASWQTGGPWVKLTT